VGPGEEQFIKLVNTCGDKGERKMNSSVRDMAIKTFIKREEDESEV